MRNPAMFLGIFLAVLAGLLFSAAAGAQPGAVEIVCPADAPALQQFAAKEVRRYLYLRTNAWLPILAESAAPGQIRLTKDPALAAQAFALHTLTADGKTVCTLSGGSDVAVLYAAYRFAEAFGVRYYLDSDTIPDGKIPLTLPNLNEDHKPLFELRGIQPFHDFPEGPDWWSTDNYKAIVGQLPKLGMNFVGLHTYPEDRPAAEPTTWIGQPGEVNPDGTVKAAYPAIYYNTALAVGWGFQPKPTSDYACGAGALFDRDDYGSDIMRGLTPRPETPEHTVEVFRRAGTLFHDVFSLAHTFGVKTCIGTETPLVVPRAVAAHIEKPEPPLKAEGGQVAHFAAPVADTEEDKLYQHVRYGMSAYRGTVPNGTYSVTLHFNEPYYDAPGKRVFGVLIEGQPVIERLDLFERLGKNKALVQTFDNIAVNDGQLDIEFTPITEFPCIAALAVTGASGAWKVNCGGPAYGDFAGEDPAANLRPDQIRSLYEGMFTRIKAAHPLDYYWLWTPEGWTWEGVPKATVDAAVKDIQIAYEALQAVGAPFQMATCGWVLGPQYDRSYLDTVLPKDINVSCINRQVGHEPVERGFAKVSGRGKWAIPWLEDDPAMTSPQLWVGRMRRDARDALAYGCNGLMGIHWRTRILAPNVSALAQAAWGMDGWSSDTERGSGAAGGKALLRPNGAIAKTLQSNLYRTQREAMTAYRIVVPNGNYRVILRFCDPWNKEPGKRVFSARLEGAPVLNNLDIVAEAGQAAALDKIFDAVVVNDGVLDIDFEKNAGEPILAAIDVEGAAATVKIDCGGDGAEGYEPDLKPISPHPYALDFYRDWAAQNFGAKDDGMARLFARLDGQLPRASDWIGGPGGYKPDPRPWSEVQAAYAFVDELAAFRPVIQGAGNIERFDYWLNTFRYLRATAKMRCVWNDYNKALAAVRAQPKNVVREKVLPVRTALVRTAEEVVDLQLATTTTTGAMGTLCNLEQHTFPDMLDKPGKELEALLGEALPPEAQARRTYAGAPRLVVTAERSSLQSGEGLEVRAAVLDAAAPQSIALCWRPLGDPNAPFQRVPMALLGRQTYTARLESGPIAGNDFEYYLEATASGGAQLRWPATAPETNQSVVILPPGAA